MIDCIVNTLILGSFLFAIACLVQCLKLAWKRPFPTNAPKLVSGYPVVGALQLFLDRERFCLESKSASSTGNYSYYLGQHRVVGVSGSQGRHTFFKSQDLNFEQGTFLIFPLASVIERPDDPSAEIHGSNVRSTLRTQLLRTQGLKCIPAAIEDCTTTALNHIAARGLIDPFQELTSYFAQSFMAIMGINEVARSRSLSQKLSEQLSALDGTFSAADVVVPCLLNPFNIPTAIDLGRLCITILQIVRKRKQQQQQGHPVDKQDPGTAGMLQDMIEKGWSTREIVKVLISTALAAQGNSPGVTSWMLIELATNKHWLARVRNEISEVVSRHKKDRDSADQALRSLDVRAWEHEFPLLRACLLESVRLAALLLLVRKNIGAFDVPIGDTGEVIPPGAYVTYDFHEVARNPDVYHEPQLWDPGRFLSDRAEHLKEPLAFAGFGGGRRKCRKFVHYLTKKYSF
ncbi:unnamed protein product [Aspergillus niger]|uniref:Unnamed protein product n=1 Tax=Aspergillus niger TaxID=5061 RepID=A0A100IR61_ASPNG|nr:unnamed protein product [Aspergillus niger]